jgi:hypothetical protein
MPVEEADRCAISSGMPSIDELIESTIKVVFVSVSSNHAEDTGSRYAINL